MEEKILKELKAINTQLKEFDAKLEKQKKEICTEFDAKLEKQKKEICTEVNVKLAQLREDIIKEVSAEFWDHINNMNDKKNEVVKELREHKMKTLKGVRAFENVLVH